jgi:hypothetical protein
MDNQLTQNPVRARADEKRDQASASARAASSVAMAKMDAVLATGSLYRWFCEPDG